MKVLHVGIIFGDVRDFLIFSLTSLTSMLVAPASSEFSMSSFTAELTEVITCELAINRTVDEGSRFIAHGTEDVSW